MPTINEVLERVSRSRPDAVDDREKAKWLIELDGQIYETLTKADNPSDLPPADYPADGDKSLLIPPPWDRVYDFYVMAMVEFQMRDYEEYQNSYALFNQAMTEYRAQYRRNSVPGAASYVTVW